jgi:hypothetical protein
MAAVLLSGAAGEWETGVAQNNGGFDSLIDAKGSGTKWKSTHHPNALA